MSLLYDRVTREHDNREYKRKPAKGDLILELEKIINLTHKIIGFDGYIIPKNGSRVTLLLYCREYNQELVKDKELVALAQILFDEMNKAIDFKIAIEFSKKLKCDLTCVFIPYNYPKDDEQAIEQEIILFPKINIEKKVKRTNVDGLRLLLKNYEKRFTRKAVTFIPTKLEYYLANIPKDQWKIAFPGDADGIFMDENYNVQAILEYKSDTQGRILEEESIQKYNADSTRFSVLDDFCKLLNVPLVVVFWSDTHSNTKITIRNSVKGIENSLPIIKSNDYNSCAKKIYDVLLNLSIHMNKLDLL
ncbi:hypothetical protein ACBT_0194 [Aliarcobacter cibarius]|uniref:Uncharacterized protein n=1 Tax=Aliarcobacter cibarius TaxID=255507 RepID=A0A7L5JM99_9BACT|nr:hypothetical protein [Aliarcobacter cibarius]QKJ26178.1 hypothetical protein ACBT_0194 [Aliarcobacter cibarius]